MTRGKSTDIALEKVALYFLPVTMRTPLKFGKETIASITCVRVRVTVRDKMGRLAYGWGETPLSVAWVWLGTTLSFSKREELLKLFCQRLCHCWCAIPDYGHPLELGSDFIAHTLRQEHREFNREAGDSEVMPWLAALVCASAFDIAIHDAYGNLHNSSTYKTYNRDFLNRDLSAYLTAADGSNINFNGLYPGDFLLQSRRKSLVAWHLVGGMDPVDATELTGKEPNDGYPVLLTDWIRRDGLTCLKIKLRGNDAEWDYSRLVKIGKAALAEGVKWLTADFNCLVLDPYYVNAILDRLIVDEPRLYGMILYVEQPFPYELTEHPIDVHSVAARKPLFMDESAHDWQMVRLGRTLGWSGVALKTCKTQSGALLALCWAKAHGMTLMVQDLTNPMLAQITHLLLAAHVGTIMGVETNAMQFYPEVSNPEAAVHPGIYQRRHGAIDLSTISGSGFGYQVERIQRVLPEPITVANR